MAALPLRVVLQAWWPLAVSWLFMTVELTITTAAIARMAAPDINLAAWSIILAISTLVQAPAVTLLPTSTALSSDAGTYGRLRIVVFVLLSVLTCLHALIAFTPLYGGIVEGLLGAPAVVSEAARPGLAAMVAWSAGTGYRRFLQGVLIRFGHSRVVLWGTLVRLAFSGMVLVLGLARENAPGATTAAVAVIAGVVAEAAYTRWMYVRKDVVRFLREAPSEDPPRWLKRFVDFYAPLVAMTLLTMAIQSLVAAALAHLPLPLPSLATWPVVFGFLLIWQSPGIAYTEVVISLLSKPGARAALRRFTGILFLSVTAFLLAFAATPAARWWFLQVAGLSPELATLAHRALLLGVLIPGLRILQSWYQGIIMHGRHTRPLVEAVVLFFVTAVVVVAAGSIWGESPGLYFGVLAFLGGLGVQVAWLRLRRAPASRRGPSGAP